MNAHERQRIGTSREVLRLLRHLGDVRAPATLLPAVLRRVGLSDAYTQVETAVGPVFVAYNDIGITAIMRAATPQMFEQIFRDRFGRAVHRVAQLPPGLANVLEQPLHRLTRASQQVDLCRLSAFERAVLLKVREIPRGEVRPYAWVAREIGAPKAVRAVGSALRRNPIPLLIPCHRVVCSDGSTGEYIFGREAKRAVLAAEGVDMALLGALARSGTRYYGSDTTHIYCFPTCRHARRITQRHRVAFRSQRQAAAAGYRPCRVCRPALAS
jgi:O-6-methylguanine DNA methyltransferase